MLRSRTNDQAIIFVILIAKDARRSAPWCQLATGNIQSAIVVVGVSCRGVSVGAGGSVL